MATSDGDLAQDAETQDARIHELLELRTQGEWTTKQNQTSNIHDPQDVGIIGPNNAILGEMFHAIGPTYQDKGPAAANAELVVRTVNRIGSLLEEREFMLVGLHAMEKEVDAQKGAKNLCREQLAASQKDYIATRDQLEAEQMEFARLREALVSLSALVDGADNGHCRLCGGYRLYDTHSNLQPCENEDCISHRVAQAL